ncbi:hypothetical protein Drorol1_Dr00018462 [Drosera rotundifolia]
MPPPPPPPPHFRPPSPPPLLLLLITILFTLLTPLSSSPTNPCTTAAVPCPPFNSSAEVPYPFSAAVGCGHPAFQVRCSSPHALISINNLSFSIIRFISASSSLRLSPNTTTTTTRTGGCTAASVSLPSRPIDISGTPFRVPASTCSLLQRINACSQVTGINCTLCPWVCSLGKNPSSLIHDCSSHHHRRQETSSQIIPCGIDVVLDGLLGFLRKGFILQRSDDEDRSDDYFTGCRDCRSRNGSCGYNSSDSDKRFLCFDSIDIRGSTSILIGSNKMKLLIAFLVIFMLLCFLCSLVIAALLLCSNRRFLSPSDSIAAAFISLRHQGHSTALAFTFDELESSTNGFDPTRKLGDGGFGSVYLGHLPDGRAIAVKHLHRRCSAAFSLKSFNNEITIMSSISHPNLVPLLGYCTDPRGLFLVYDFVPNGTLADHLHNNPKQTLINRSPMPWQTRISIALQVATAMEYLHHTIRPPVVHRDITTSNIFLDENMIPKLGDFGMLRSMPPPSSSTEHDDEGFCVWTGPQGTPGYLDPDYYRSFRLTEKSDVYSFGVVMMELVTGRRAVGLVEDVVGRMMRVEDVVDEGMKAGQEEKGSVAAVAELAFRCVAAEKDDRPDAGVIAAELRRISGRG